MGAVETSAPRGAPTDRVWVSESNCSPVDAEPAKSSQLAESFDDSLS